MKKYWVIILALGVISAVGFNYYRLNQGANPSNLPVYAQRTPPIKVAYEYALENPELLENIPCYCNCYRMGHKNVKDCFIKDIKEDGGIIFDEHGANCGICYSTVLDSKKLFQEGKSSQEIRGFIDDKYSGYGLPTITPKL